MSKSTTRHEQKQRQKSPSPILSTTAIKITMSSSRPKRVGQRWDLLSSLHYTRAGNGPNTPRQRKFDRKDERKVDRKVHKGVRACTSPGVWRQPRGLERDHKARRTLRKQVLTLEHLMEELQSTKTGHSQAPRKLHA